MHSTPVFICTRQIKKTFSAFVVILLFALNTTAQFRNYGIVYSDNIQGSTIMFGNTLMAIYQADNVTVSDVQMNSNSLDGNSLDGNDFSNMRYVDIDGVTGDGAETRNSSSADLVLPAGTNNIKIARLYWGGRASQLDFDLDQPVNQKIKLRKGTTGAYTEFTASQFDKNPNIDTDGSTYWQFQAYTDITQFIKNNNSGTYTVGNAPLSVNSAGFGGNYGGWGIVIVYENPTAFPYYNAVRVYDGFQRVYDGGIPQSTSVTLTGLNIPPGNLSYTDAKMGVLTWEGDANLGSDYFLINGIPFSNEKNPVDNPWNGTITDNGEHVTNKSPNYTNQMALDIDQFYVGTGYDIQPNDDNATLEFGTEADQYFPGLFTFVIKTKDLLVSIDKFVADANNDHIVQAGEVLTYTLKGKNESEANGYLTVITDTLSSTVTYVPGSLKVISSPGISAGIKTDAVNIPAAGDVADFADYIAAAKTVIFRVGTGATNTTGGILAPGETVELQFKVTVNTPASGIVPPILNTARITSYSINNVKYTDDGSVILEPQAGPVPVILQSFAATLLQNKNVQVDWSTAQEINCKQYEIERSIDGRIFTTTGIVTGNGTSSLLHTYTFTDNAFTANATTIYYRLKQIDIDGKSKYSVIRSVRMKKTLSSLTVSPNPFNSYANIVIDRQANEAANIKVFNMAGKEMINKNIQLQSGSNYMAIDELSALPAGNYILMLTSDKEKLLKKITKQ